jgi:hypothetical protein
LTDEQRKLHNTTFDQWGQDKNEIAPHSRRKFYSAIDELEYVYSKALHWSYTVAKPAKARPFMDRLAGLLRRHGRALAPSAAVFECQALVAEYRGQLEDAVRFRRKEIDLLSRYVLRGAKVSTTDEAVQLRRDQYPSPGNLIDRLYLLAIEYWQLANYRAALQELKKSARLCTRFGIEFDGNARNRPTADVRISSRRS